MDRMDQPAERALGETVERHTGRLRGFLLARVPDRRDVEDILQDVFYELVLASRMTKPIEDVGAWLFRVAKNRVADLFRRKRTESFDVPKAADDEPGLEDLLPSPDAGPDAVYARAVLIEALADALEELPPDQRWVVLAHEAEGRTFREMSTETGVSVNTLLSRKRYAAFFLRRRLAAIYAEFKKG